MTNFMHYIKQRNNTLFKSLEKDENGKITNLQNYIPLYSKFFSCNETNWNSFNLNHKNHIKKINATTNDNEYIVTLTNNNKVHSYVKLSPLFDPIKYIGGKYKDISENTLMILPSLTDKDLLYENYIDEKKNCIYNSAYIDGFFTYLLSILKHTYKIPHCLDFYGSFLGIKHNYKINIADDLDFLQTTSFFYKNNNKLYKIACAYQNHLMNMDTRKYKVPLSFKSDLSQPTVYDPLDEYTKTLPTIDMDFNNDISYNIIYDNDISNHEIHSISSSCSSRKSSTSCESNTIEICNNVHLEGTIHLSNDNTSNIISIQDKNLFCQENFISDIHKTIPIKDNSFIENKFENMKESNNTSENNNNHTYNNHDNNKENDLVQEYEEDDHDEEDEEEDEDDDDDENIDVTINKFPVQLIFMEKCDMTLDELMTNFEIEENEWIALLLQIIMTLIIYQKVFNCTHNDLHTNNIMFTHTDKKFIYYKVNNTYYKVPTYNKIFKIIDFGRAVYKINNIQICSDSYHEKGDATGQYNCEPFYNISKPKIEPNNSFDLCRLGCALFDYFIDDINYKPHNDLEKMIYEWCNDDNNKNILYKQNGKERYPGFKLYKMIARSVHNHIPIKQLERNIFTQFVITSKYANKKNVVNIDKLPVLYSL